MIQVLFFGRMADIVRRRAVSLPCGTGQDTLFALRDSLFGEAAGLGRVHLDAIRMSVNQVAVRQDQAIEDGDEVAFFSVFSGG